MKKFAKQFIYGCAILTTICFAPISRAEVVTPPSQSPQIESLRLPSFSIFGLEEAKDDPKWNVQYPEEELQKMLIEIEKWEKDQAGFKVKSGKKLVKTSDANVSFFIPLVMYRSRRLFTQSAWSTSDVEEAQRISRFFARALNRPELEIHSSTPGSFRDGLVNLRNFYADLCNRNSTLAEMIFTFDDGPYFGFALPRERFSSLRVLQSMKIPGRTEKFALMTDGKKHEPILIGVLASSGAVKWASRFSKHPDGTIDGAELFAQSAKEIKGYGFVCSAGVGGEGSRIYLDENLNLRFYFVSW